MKPIFYILFSLISYTAASQSVTPLNVDHIDSIQSQILDEERKIWVYVPNKGPFSTFAKERYPVVYLLDGDLFFHSTVGAIQYLSSAIGNTIFPEMIVVGILNNNRTRDLTPTHVNYDPEFGDSNSLKHSGGGGKFLTFIEKELIPYIESAYGALPYRTFVGHSYGGLAVMNAFINHKQVFNNYIAIDPSVSWDKSLIIQQTAKSLSKDSYGGKSLFLGIANTLPREMDTAKVTKDTSSSTKHLRSVLSLNDVLRKANQPNLSYAYKYYPDDNHGSVPLITIYDGLRFIFQFYHMKMYREDWVNFSMKTIGKFESHYQKISQRFGFKYDIPEPLVNQLGYHALSQKKMIEAEYLFKRNISSYPTSSNVYDSMADFYHSQGDKLRAIQFLKKALAIKEDAQSRAKLNYLEKSNQ